MKDSMFLVLWAAFAVAMAGCGGDDAADSQSSEKPADELATPQAAFDAYIAAQLAGDFKKEFSLLTPSSRKLILTDTIATALARSARDRELAALLKKHGIDRNRLDLGETVSGSDIAVDPERMKMLMAAIDDQPTFYAAVTEAMHRAETRSTGDAEESPTTPKAELINVKIDGDTAEGTPRFTVEGKQMDADQPAKFQKIDGRWYVHLGE